MNYVYLGIGHNEHFQQSIVYISHIGEKIDRNQLYVTLTDEELKEACEERLFASVRFLYNEGSERPKSVILVKDGEECNIGSENDEYCLDDLVSMYFEDSSSESDN